MLEHAATFHADAMLVKFENDLSICGNLEEVVVSNPVLIGGGLAETNTAAQYTFSPFTIL